MFCPGVFCTSEFQAELRMRAQGAALDRVYLDALVRGLAADLARPGIEEFYLSCF